MANFEAKELKSEEINRGEEYQNGDALLPNDINKMVSGILYGYEETNDLKNQNANNFSNTLKGLKSGKAVSITDVSPIEHTMSVKVSGKNLIKYPYLKSTHTVNGITFTDNGDGTITANGTATGQGYFVLAELKLKKGTYFLSGAPKDGKEGTQLYLANSNYSVYKIDNGSGVIVEITDEKAVYTIAIDIKAGTTTENSVFKPQLELGTVATDYEPYFVDVSKVKLIKSGKNVFDINAFSNSSNWIADANNPNVYRSFKLNLLPNTTYTFSQGGGADPNPSGYALYALFSPTQHSNSASDSQWIISSGNNSRTNKKITFTTNQTGVHYINMYYDSGRLSRLSAYLSKAQIEQGNSVTEYEPYEQIDYIPNSDGTVEGVTSIYPTTTLTTDNANTLITAEYNKDLNKAFAELYNAIISLGGNV